jgi:hypothetical protein
MKLVVRFVFFLIALSPPAYANQDIRQTLDEKTVFEEAFISFRVALIESKCGAIASRKGKPDFLLVTDYQTYCLKNDPVAMFARLQDGRTASIEICNRGDVTPKIYCPEAAKFNFYDAIRFSN